MNYTQNNEITKASPWFTNEEAATGKEILTAGLVLILLLQNFRCHITHWDSCRLLPFGVNDFNKSSLPFNMGFL
jgi:hypothetical protein